MANPDHLAKLTEGVEHWNRSRAEAPRVRRDLTGADLSGKDLSGMDLSLTDLARANLSGANLQKTRFLEANLVDANLRGALLSHTAMMGADLSGADLSHTRTEMVGLSGANLTRANIQNSIFVGGDFRTANLSQADLGFANFIAAYFDRADLRAAKLWRTTFTECSLDEADLADSHMGRTALADIDLSSVRGLAEVGHAAPSHMSIGTIYKSGGKIPHIFLRGVGVPETFITFAGSLVGKPIEFYSCFISYSTKDQQFADRLYSDLQANGVRCWFAPHDIQGGRKIHEQIDEAIRVYDKLLLILSEDSMNSNWVKTEIANARAREEQQKRQMLFPIALAPFDSIKQWKLFDADTGTDSAREIREYYIPDFSNWKDHDQYQKAFDRLLRDLKAETERAAAQS